MRSKGVQFWVCGLGWADGAGLERRLGAAVAKGIDVEVAAAVLKTAKTDREGGQMCGAGGSEGGNRQ